MKWQFVFHRFNWFKHSLILAYKLRNDWMNLKKTLTLSRHVHDVISFPSLVLDEF